MTDDLALDSPDDVDTLDDVDGREDDDAGNRVSGGTPLAVVTYLVNSITSDPAAVVINTEERGDSVRFRIHVAPDDMGRVIGRRGRVAASGTFDALLLDIHMPEMDGFAVAQAIRTVVAAAGARDGVQTSVDIIDD